MKWLVDSHCHLDDVAYEEDRTELISSLSQEGILAVINPGCDRESSFKSLALAEENPGIFACLGTHPQEAASYTGDWEAEMKDLLRHPKAVAVGEIGLDYHYDTASREKQWEVFERQLQVAEDCQKPVVIHSREAGEDTLSILKNFGGRLKILMHSFNEEVESWDRLEDWDCYISLGGMVTFKNAPNPKALAKRVSEERILLETDGPYLAPVPKRGRRNRPGYCRFTLSAIAALRETSPDRLADVFTENAGRFYGIQKELKALREQGAENDAGLR